MGCRASISEIPCRAALSTSMTDRTRVILLGAAAIVLPLAAVWVIPQLPSLRATPDVFSGGTIYPDSELPFESVALDPQVAGLPLMTNVQILDVDGDGRNDVLACDASRNRVSMFSRNAGGDGWTETILVDNVPAPAHATAVDLDRDGDLDLIVSVLGSIFPDDTVIGRVELYEKTDDGYVRHVLLEDIRRVADVQAADFDGDGDLDLAVAVFGYSRGEVLWMENHGDWQFQSHQLLNAPGTIHVPIADYDGDGDPDIMAIVTQDEEELWGFENLGGGRFEPRRLWLTDNFDLGSAGLVAADLDSDGDMDLILPAGDNLEDTHAYPQPYHGCYWFENLGGWKFEQHRISDLGGCYAADVGDLDGDGDLDVVLVSMSNDWYDRRTASVIWLENDGKQNFRPWQIASDPIHLVTVAVGDLNADGCADVVAGGLNFRQPYERIGRVHAWLNKGQPQQGQPQP